MPVSATEKPIRPSTIPPELQHQHQHHAQKVRVPCRSYALFTCSPPARPGALYMPRWRRSRGLRRPRNAPRVLLRNIGLGPAPRPICRGSWASSHSLLLSLSFSLLPPCHLVPRICTASYSIRQAPASTHSVPFERCVVRGASGRRRISKCLSPSLLRAPDTRCCIINLAWGAAITRGWLGRGQGPTLPPLPSSDVTPTSTLSYPTSALGDCWGSGGVRVRYCVVSKPCIPPAAPVYVHPHLSFGIALVPPSYPRALAPSCPCTASS